MPGPRPALFGFVLVLGACGASEREAEPPAASEVAVEPSPPPSEQTATESTTPARPASICAPLVHGCGCAYQCGLGHLRPDGNYDVTHDFQDSRIDVSVLARRCFDAAGRSYYAEDAPAEATHCLDVFYDRTPCGGECIPTTDYIDCVFVDDRCRPR